jgi:hypothetical protein
MSMRSGFVTCPTDSTMRGYIIPGLPTTVIEDMLVVDEKADKLYQQILADYKEVIYEFEKLSELYMGASKVSTGRMRKAYIKVARKCSEQAESCSKRSRELTSAFEYNLIEGKVNSIENALNKEDSGTAEIAQ